MTYIIKLIFAKYLTFSKSNIRVSNKIKAIFYMNTLIVIFFSIL